MIKPEQGYAMQKIESPLSGIPKLFQSIMNSLKATPYPFIMLSLFFTWCTFTLQGDAFSYFQPESDALNPPWSDPMLANSFTYLFFGVVYFFAKRTFSGRKYQIIVFCLMFTGIIVIESVSYLDETTIATMSYLLKMLSVAIGITTACMYIEINRLLKAVGIKNALIHGMLGVFGAGVLLTLLNFVPFSELITTLFLIITPIAMLFMFLRIAPLTSIADEQDTELFVPWKLIITVLIQSFAYGAVISITKTHLIDPAILPILGFVFTGCLLFITALFLKMDFNHLLYHIGFPLLALGFMFISISPETLILGEAFATVGYRYILILVCILCVFLSTEFKLSIDWLVPWANISLAIGHIIGATVTNALISTAETPLSGIHVIAPIILASVLLVALFMISDKNLDMGWGAVKPSEDTTPAISSRRVCDEICSVYSLTKREGEILLLLTKGRSALAIGETLGLSVETVKTHMKNVYKKLDVHSKQELLDLVEQCGTALNEQLIEHKPFSG